MRYVHGKVRAGAVEAAGVLTITASCVAAVPMLSADAATANMTVLNLRLAGNGVADRSVVVRAIDIEGQLGAVQRSVVTSRGRTSAAGVAAFKAAPAHVATFQDAMGYVNFEAMVVIDGAPRFTSFSRRWTGARWVDRDGTPANATMPFSTAQVAAPATAPTPGTMTDVAVAPAVAASSEVPCSWYDDRAGNAYTKIGEFHTGANTSGSLTYGQTADSDIGVDVDYGSGWIAGGGVHVSNSKASYVRFNNHSGFHRQLKSQFQYIHWHLTLGPSCAGSSRWGKRYYKVTASRWQGGTANGALISGRFCTGTVGVTPFRPGDDFYRGEKRALTYGVAVGAFGAPLSATSGYSRFVDMNWHFGNNTKVRHLLCGRPNIFDSKVVYAR